MPEYYTYYLIFHGDYSEPYEPIIKLIPGEKPGSKDTMHLLDPNLTPEVVKERLLSPRFRNRQFAGLLLDQAFLAGLGNYLRVEILWQVGLTGNHKAKDLNAAQLDALAHALLEIPRFSYATRGQVDENKHHGALFRFKVFHRDGEPCERCGSIIEKTTLSSRPFYWCPGCQH